jgi:acetolactate synthase-1/3 small subunit
VLKVVALADEGCHTRSAAFVTVGFFPGQLTQIMAIAVALSAELVDVDQAACTLFIAAEPTTVGSLLRALGGFDIRDVVTTPPLRLRKSRLAGHDAGKREQR